MKTSDYFKTDGTPIKCTKCGSKNLNDLSKYESSGIIIEMDILCSDCDEVLGYWAYGSWDSNFMDAFNQEKKS